MALFGSFRSRRVARQAEEALARGGWDAAAAVLARVEGLGAGPWAHFALRLYNTERRPEAERAISRALEIEPERGDALIFLAELQAEGGQIDEAIATYRSLLTRFPGAAAQAIELAKLLVQKEAFYEARRVLLPFARAQRSDLLILLAKLYYELGEYEPAVALLAPMVRQMKLELGGAIYGSARGSLVAEYDEAMRLHDDAYAALHGREKVIEGALARGDLDARAGVNYRLLGEARLAQPARWEADTRLRSVEEGLVFGESLLAAGQRSRGLCHMGVSRLRQGRLAEARQLFDDARGEDDRSFAAYLGLGAVMDLARAEAFERLASVLTEAEAETVPGVNVVVADWPVLTGEERRAVAAAAAPLGALLPRIVAAGARARILPIDARLTDLPEMEAEPNERFEDYRCLEAVTGAATASLCASKVEELLDFMGDRDWVFAHELAHLAHFHAPPELNARIEEIYRRALEEEHVITAYQGTNVAEFFAVAYTDYLAHQHQLSWRRELDDVGIVKETFDLIRSLAR